MASHNMDSPIAMHNEVSLSGLDRTVETESMVISS